ncbi:MAG: DNA-binding transcriptional MerR regulator [Alteromonas naphthalenivorans]|jgi:DNA-binding transcriptional MerR regulator
MKMQRKQFRIGELAKSLGVKRFVIRFWEKEFNFNGHRSEGGQRFYEERDLERFKFIKTLLYEKGFTIAGAKKQLKQDDPPFIASQRTTIDTESKVELNKNLITFKKTLIDFRKLIS